MVKQRLLETVTLETLFSNGNLYRVPLYQRDYAWGEEQWEALWQDVVESRSAPLPHYIGALVLQRGAKGSMQVIDGQQRLATILAACVGVLELGDQQRSELLRARFDLSKQCSTDDASGRRGGGLVVASHRRPARATRSARG